VSGLDIRPAAATGDRTGTLFRSSRRLSVLDHFRVPYARSEQKGEDDIGHLRSSTAGPVLFWSMRGDAPAVAAAVPGVDGATSIPIHAKVLPDHVAEPLLRERGSGWQRARLLTGREARPLGSIWRSDEGSVFLPFDPDEVMLNCLSERYLTIAGGAVGHRARRAMTAAYYVVRPLISRRLQIWLRRGFTAAQASSQFPRWPVETCLHDFFALMFDVLASIAEEPVPSIAPWPRAHTWALVLTHDVERQKGWQAIDRILELERAAGVRSCWNLVPQRDYEVDPKRVNELKAKGLEIGVHGLRHDGRDLASLRSMQARLPGMRAAAASWGAVGFRSPSTHRHWNWMPLLGFDYDSSYPDTDPYEPQAGGCCTWLPFFNEGMVELPVTLAQDHTLFVILRADGEATWVSKASLLRSRGGMALINTHPDYLVEDRVFRAYEHFLDRFASDPSAWKALPREVSAWWRRRAACSLERDGDGWRVVGLGSDEARIELLGGPW
jgi:hypothetical protein